jgi:hypothetical protein
MAVLSVLDVLISEELDGKTLVRFTLTVILAFFLLRGSAVAMKITRVLMGLGLALAAVLGCFAYAQPQLREHLPGLLVLCAFYTYYVWMLTMNKRLRVEYA